MVEVSVSKRSITPNFPMFMRGYAMRTGKSIGVMDELYCRTLALRIDGEVFIWVTVDICMIEGVVSDYIRAVAAARYSVPRSHIVIASVHTHAGPDISFRNEGEERNRKKAVYRAYMVEQIFAAVDECFERGFLEAEPYVVQCTIDGVYGNRSYKDKPADKEVNLIQFRSAGHVAAGIFQFACHPTVLGINNMKLSSDLIGNVGNALDTLYQTTFLTMQGACGDMGNRQYRQGNDERELRRVRDALMEQLREAALRPGAERPLRLEAGKVDSFVYRVQYKYDLELLRRQIAEGEKKLSAAVTEDERKLLWSGVNHQREKLEEGGVDVSLETILFHLGDLELVTVPGELFSTFGLRVKAAMKAPVRIVWGYANHVAGYIVEKDEYGKGYESMSTPFPQGEAERYVEEIIKNL